MRGGTGRLTRPGTIWPPMKLLSLSQAIDRFVPDGASIALGTALEALIPFAAAHELIRHQRRDLELIGPISDILFAQLLGSGCVRPCTAPWPRHGRPRLRQNYPRPPQPRTPA